MAGLVTSRCSTPAIIVCKYGSATNFLSDALSELCSSESSANIIFAHALKRVQQEAGREFSKKADLQRWLSSRAASTSINSPSRSFWLVVWSCNSLSRQRSLDIVLSCTDWTLGDYPIFLWSPHHAESVKSAWIAPRMTQLCDALRSSVTPERVFAVFGQTYLSGAFQSRWTTATGYIVEPEPFYEALYTYCTPTTFNNQPMQLPAGHEMRRATPGDLIAVRQLCQEFAEDGVYYPLTVQRAQIEAQEFISKNQMWVYNVNGECSTICAITRNTFKVSAITKVYTTPKYRKMGCAEKLVRFVTHRLLFHDRKDVVTLYVGNENNAQRVYDRVGFVGLCGKNRIAGVEDALELGFAGTNRGYW